VQNYNVVEEILGNVKQKIASLNKPYEIKEIIIKEVLSNQSVDFKDVDEIINEIYSNLEEYGKIQKYLNDKDVSEIMINGTENIFIEKNGNIEKANFKLSKYEIRNLIEKIVSDINRKINKKEPIVDARLKDGSRVNIVLENVAKNGPIITIRKFIKRYTTSQSLIDAGAYSREIELFLKDITKSKKNILISGSTGTGKTTLLNVLANFVKSDERIITIEDSFEINIRGVENIVALEKRNKNIEGNDEILISDLIKTSLRMRPDRIIVGEVRGVEVVDMLTAMNTGHNGSISTIHSNSCSDSLIRLETMYLEAKDVSVRAIRRQIYSAIDFIIQLERKDGKRYVGEIAQVIRKGESEIGSRTIYEKHNGYYIRENNILQCKN